MAIVPTIYGAGGEDTSFLQTGTITAIGDNGWNRGLAAGFNPPWSRGGVAVNGTTTDPPGNMASTKLLSNFAQEFWTRATFGGSALWDGSTTANAQMLRLRFNGTAKVLIRGTSTNGQIALCSRTNAGVIAQLGATLANALPTTGLKPHTLDLRTVFAGAVLQSTGPQTTVTFNNTNPPTIVRSTGDFATDGFKSLDIITVTGSASNNGVYDIGSVATNTITLVPSEILVAEAAGASVTIFTSGSMTLYFNSNQVGRFVGAVTTDVVVGPIVGISVTPTHGGTGYAAGDTFTIGGGTAGVGTVTLVAAGVAKSVLITTPGTGYQDATGVTTTVLTGGGDGTLQVNVAALRQLNSVDLASPSTSNAVVWSEMFVSDTRTINAGMWTISPVAAGITQTWAGVVASINEFTINDANFISVGTSAAISNWTVSSTPPTGAWIVAAVIQEARVAIASGGLGPQNFKFSIFSNSGQFATSNVTPAPTPAFASYNNQIYAVNPNTSAAWVIGDITVGFNAGIESAA